MPARERSAGGRVDHHRDVHVVEAARANERDLPATALLRWGADCGELARELVHHRAHSDGCGDADHGDEVVPAGVPDLGERVVLLEDRDRWPGRATLRVAAVRGLDVLVAALHGESRPLEDLGDPERDLAFLVCQHRFYLNRERRSEYSIAPLRHRLDRPLLARLPLAPGA